MEITKAELVGKVGGLKGCKFASFKYVRKGKFSKKTGEFYDGAGEIARHTIILGSSYLTMCEKDVQTMQEMLPTLTDATEKLAGAELLASLEQSLKCAKDGTENPDYPCKDTYITIEGVSGIKVHKETGAVYVWGQSQSKVVEKEGAAYRPVNSAAKTIAKGKLEANLRRSHFRQFDLGQVLVLKVNGETLEVEYEPKQESE